MEKKERKIVRASDGKETVKKTVKKADQEAEEIVEETPAEKKMTKEEKKKSATVKRVIACVLWALALCCELMAILVINEKIIVELKAISHIDSPHRRQLWNYMNLTHLPYGMLMNFSPDGLYSEWYHRDPLLGTIDRIKLM